jgi:Ca2+-binding EF-hand superfamily protein
MDFAHPVRSFDRKKTGGDMMAAPIASFREDATTRLKNGAVQISAQWCSDIEYSRRMRIQGREFNEKKMLWAKDAHMLERVFQERGKQDWKRSEAASHRKWKDLVWLSNIMKKRAQDMYESNPQWSRLSQYPRLSGARNAVYEHFYRAEPRTKISRARFMAVAQEVFGFSEPHDLTSGSSVPSAKLCCKPMVNLQESISSTEKKQLQKPGRSLSAKEMAKHVLVTESVRHIESIFTGFDDSECGEIDWRELIGSLRLVHEPELSHTELFDWSFALFSADGCVETATNLRGKITPDEALAIVTLGCANKESRGTFRRIFLMTLLTIPDLEGCVVGSVDNLEDAFLKPKPLINYEMFRSILATAPLYRYMIAPNHQGPKFIVRDVSLNQEGGRPNSGDVILKLGGADPNPSVPSWLQIPPIFKLPSLIPPEIRDSEHLCELEREFYDDFINERLHRARKHVADLLKAKVFLMRMLKNREIMAMEIWVSFRSRRKRARELTTRFVWNYEMASYLKGFRRWQWVTMMQVGATQIQLFYRSRRAVWAFRYIVHLNEAAKDVQRLFRGRRAFLLTRRIMALRHAKATCLQAHYRGHCGRKRARQVLLNHVEKQRQMLAKERWEWENRLLIQGAKRVQRGWRSRVEKMKANAKMQGIRNERVILKQMADAEVEAGRQVEIYRYQVEEFYKKNYADLRNARERAIIDDREKQKVLSLRRKRKWDAQEDRELQKKKEDEAAEKQRVVDWEVEKNRQVDADAIAERERLLMCLQAPVEKEDRKEGVALRKIIAKRVKPIIKRFESNNIPIETPEAEQKAEEEVLLEKMEQKRVEVRERWKQKEIEFQNDRKKREIEKKVEVQNEDERKEKYAAKIFQNKTRQYYARKQMKALVKMFWVKEYDVNLECPVYYNSRTKKKKVDQKPVGLFSDEMPYQPIWYKIDSATSDDRLTYYFFPETMEVSWKIPEGCVPYDELSTQFVSKDWAEAHGVTASGNTTTDPSAILANMGSDSDDLANNSAWTQHSDEAGHVYYFNATTGESTWSMPSDFQSRLRERMANNPSGGSVLQQLRSAFDEFDADSSGFIDKQELGGLSAALGYPLDARTLQVAMNTLDRSGDGSISFEEFSEWWMGSS